jgi:hypothetical protein
MSLGTLLHLTILRCLGASVIAELVSELLRAAIFVLIKASPAARPSGHLAPLEARQLPGLFACARCAGSAACARARVCVGSDFTSQSLWLTKWWSHVPARAVRVVI